LNEKSNKLFSKWTKDYTYPGDYNILKYKLKGKLLKFYMIIAYLDTEKTSWRKLPDQNVNHIYL
jgi:hypothetical protein